MKKHYAKGNTIKQSVHNLLNGDEQKGIENHWIRGGAYSWGRWEEIWAQFGVVGRDSASYVTELKIHMRGVDPAKGPFDYEIRGGDQFTSGTAGNSRATDYVTISGNVATSVRLRIKSHHVLDIEVLATVQSRTIKRR